MGIKEGYGKMRESRTCNFGNWEGDFIGGCRREDCVGGIVQYDD